jgi:hypothetical protein
MSRSEFVAFAFRCLPVPHHWPFVQSVCQHFGLPIAKQQAHVTGEDSVFLADNRSRKLVFSRVFGRVNPNKFSAGVLFHTIDVRRTQCADVDSE